MEMFDFSDNPTLREIVEKLERVSTADGVAVDTETGEIIPPELWHAIAAKKEDKIRAYIAVIKDLRARAAAHKEEAKRQTRRAKSQESRAAYLSGILAEALQGKDYEGAEGRAVFGETRGKVVITDAGKIPSEWVKRMEPVFDKDGMNKYLAMGGEIPGAELVKERKMSVK